MSALSCAMNELSNHDHSRFLTRTNRTVGRISYSGAAAASQGINPAVMREAVAIQMTWPGAPTVYYGDEAGLCGFTDPDNRRTYPWNREDTQMLEFHRIMIRIHKAYPVIREGSLEYLWNENQGLCYGRFTKHEQLIIVLNNQPEERELIIPAWKTGITRQGDTLFERVLLSDQDSFTEEKEYYPARDGIMRVEMPGFGVMILHHGEE